MKVLAIAASNNTKSINKMLAAYTAELIENAEIEVLDLNDFEMPIFSEQKEAESGLPQQAEQFISKIAEHDAVVISFAEHNGSYSAAYKNVFDWASRVKQDVFQGKPMIMLAASPGPGGAASVLSLAEASAPYFDADVKATVSFPDFYENFNIETGTVNNESLDQQLNTAAQKLS